MSDLKKPRNQAALLALLLAVLATGCGRATTVSSVDSPQIPTIPTYPVVTNSPAPDSGFMPALSFSFTMTGGNGLAPYYTTPALYTDNLLKVRITAGPADHIKPLDGSYSNFTANYNCVSYYLTVAGATRETQIFAVNGGSISCPGGGSEQVIDFSDRLGPGHGPMTVQVSAAKSDYYCQTWGYGWIPGTLNMYCPMRTVYMTHTVTGTLDIQVNGTTL